MLNENLSKWKFKEGIIKNKKTAIDLAVLLANSFRKRGDTVRFIPSFVALSNDSIWFVDVVRTNVDFGESLCIAIRKEDGKIIRVVAFK